MGHIRVLVVDADAACREALREIFDHTDGLTVVGVATSGQEALDVASSLCPDVVVVDVQMPHLDGIAVAKALGCKEKRPAIVCLSVYPTRHDEACAAGVSCFILKDSPAEALVRAVRESAERANGAQLPLVMPEAGYPRIIGPVAHGDCPCSASTDVDLPEAWRSQT